MLYMRKYDTFVTIAHRAIPYIHGKEPTLAIADEDLAGDDGLPAVEGMCGLTY